MYSSRLIGVGAFVLGGAILFAVGLFMIGERRMLFADKFEVYTEFARLGGLENGSTVRVGGLDAGEVLEINVPAGPASRFRVKLRIREDLHPIIRTDSVATIQTDGLVGNKVVQVGAGTERAPRAPNGSTIPSKEPFELADLIRQMSETVSLANKAIVQLQADIETVFGQVDTTVEEANQLIRDVGTGVTAITAHASRVAADSRAIVEGLRAGKGTIGKLLTDDQLYRDVASIAKQAEEAVTNAKQASEEARKALAGLRDRSGPVQGVAADLRQTLSQTREVVADMAENTEALKHNFFFKGFFNRRGYFDLDEIGTAAYRRGALAGKDRSALRIWVDAAVLFAKEPNGLQVVSAGGKARLDSAMAAFLPYPPASPLIIEGYATEGSHDQQFLDSRERAALVREYVIQKFHLNPNRVGIMPLGAVADGSPKGRAWDGVALALFVKRDALRSPNRQPAAAPANAR
ncbi:MAG: MCE family protein [Acidobacteria bacterium]|nr:MCE family protein [Acidobacteriota bacterium]